MTNILAIETSSDACSIALCKRDEDFLFHDVMPQQHTKKLLPLIDEMLINQDLSYQNLDAIAVGCGPGSFTGVRLACSVAQGLSYSLGISAIKVSSLEVMAEHFNTKYQAKKVVTLVNAHMGQIYLGIFEYDHELSSFSEVGIQIEEFDVSGFTSETYFVGNGCDLVKKQLNKIKPKIYNHFPQAIDLLNIAKKRLAKGQIIKPEMIIPVYLTGEEHWKKS